MLRHISSIYFVRSDKSLALTSSTVNYVTKPIDQSWAYTDDYNENQHQHIHTILAGVRLSYDNFNVVNVVCFDVISSIYFLVFIVVTLQKYAQCILNLDQNGKILAIVKFDNNFHNSQT